MSALNTFNDTFRLSNKGLHIDAALNVRFIMDGPWVLDRSDHYYKRRATRYVTKRYSWRGYTQSMAKHIASLYNGGFSASYEGYFRMLHRVVLNAETQTWEQEVTPADGANISISNMGGGLWSVDIDLDEAEEFLVFAGLPTQTFMFGDFCRQFYQRFPGKPWAAYGSELHLYDYEQFYDEPWTQTNPDAVQEVT